jgi:septum formation protein
MNIILATSSPYRREAFGFLGVGFECEGSEIDENFPGRPERPEELVRILSRLKAESVAKKHKEGIVIGFDSVGYFNNSVLEKPKSREEAFQRLKALSGNSFHFFTGIHMISLSSGEVLSRVVKTGVFMRKISDQEINRYLDQDPGYNTYALGFDPLGNYSSSFIRGVEGSYNNVLRGIPLEAVVEMLSEAGFEG